MFYRRLGIQSNELKKYFMDEQKTTLIVNLVGAPGSGKSTLAAKLFSMLKENGIDCEMALEYAKEKLWEGTLDSVSQLYIFARQEERLRSLKGKVDVIITDAPHVHSLMYGDESDEFKQLVKKTIKEQNAINFFVQRDPDHIYDFNGREQTEEESMGMEDFLLDVVDNNLDTYREPPMNKFMGFFASRTT